MRTHSNTDDAKFIDDIDEEMMDEIDGDIDGPLEAKSRRSAGEYLRKIEAKMEERRLKHDLDDYDDWDFDDE